MLLTYIIYAREFLAGPHTPYGIMRVAEYQESGTGIGGTGSKAVEVHLIAVCVAAMSQRTGQNLAAVVAYRGEEAVVDGGLYDNLVARLGESFHYDTQGRNHPAGVLDPLTPDVPPMTAVEPTDYRLIIAVGNKGIAKHAMSHTPLQGIDDGRSRREVHVGNP
jgi:hypothetical protein